MMEAKNYAITTTVRVELGIDKTLFVEVLRQVIWNEVSCPARGSHYEHEYVLTLTVKI